MNFSIECHLSPCELLFVLYFQIKANFLGMSDLRFFHDIGISIIGINAAAHILRGEQSFGEQPKCLVNTV